MSRVQPHRAAEPAFDGEDDVIGPTASARDGTGPDFPFGGLSDDRFTGARELASISRDLLETFQEDNDATALPCKWGHARALRWRWEGRVYPLTQTRALDWCGGRREPSPASPRPLSGPTCARVPVGHVWAVWVPPVAECGRRA